VTSEILDEERATAILEQAGSWAEGICHCRHVKSHLGQRCGYPLEHCLALGAGAEYLIRAGLARRIDKARALDVLVHAREHDCVQMADNVRRRPTFICNCCSCCCEMLEGFRVLRDNGGRVTSNHVAEVSSAECLACGDCVAACPIGALSIPEAAAGSGEEAFARVDAGMCLGCGVCRRHCPSGALRMRRIAVRVHTPETQLERMMLQALERGKLAYLVFDDQTSWTQRTMAAALRTLLRLPPAKQLLARRQLRSRFVELLLGGLKRSPGSWATKV
jgi:Pyruvate/2-oxoacid:ferredoxin oxidoreductase delta subunit